MLCLSGQEVGVRELGFEVDVIELVAKFDHEVMTLCHYLVTVAENRTDNHFEDMPEVLKSQPIRAA